ncbi:MAG: YeeE/YedE family protein [Ignavibacteria bacterium]|nr:YeeE/YedE family protein [Ignavibacteria bacterium]
MGPLVPDIIGPNLNFVVALFIGIAFGWILEQAGFSTSKKLVGLFYGYDFTVLRVFFTGGIVAMAGVITLQHFGLLDINLTYINPTFIWSALVGGLIMGLGFVVGGFCPGTSVCAAAIGKIDAILFIAGSALGVLLFAEGYPLFEGLYKAGNWGNPQVFESTGLSKPLFAFLLTTMALLAFWAVSLIEARVRGEKPAYVHLSRTSIAVAGVGVLIAFSAFVLPSKKDALLGEAAASASTQSRARVMSLDEFAFRVLDADPRLQIIDFRPAKESGSGRLPKSVSFTVDNLFEKEPARLLGRRHVISVFVASDEATERRMAGIAEGLGYKHIHVLEGGLNAFNTEILHFDSTKVPHTRQEIDTYRFRNRARRTLPALIAANTFSGPVKKTIKRAVGGC